MNLKTILTICISVLLFGLIFTRKVQARIIISEILPTPASTVSRAEWVELYNPDALPVNLNNWTLAGKTITNVTLNPQSWFVFTKDVVQFNQYYNSDSAIQNVVGLNFTLANTGGNIELRNDLGAVIDQIIYADSSQNRDVSWERISSTNQYLLKHCYKHTAGNQNSNWSNSSGATICPQILFSLDSQNWQSELQNVGPTSVYLKLSEVDPESSVSWQIGDEQINDTIAFLSLNNFYTQDIKSIVSTYDHAVNIESDKLKIWPRLKITEYMRPSSTPGWIEIYNPNAFVVNIDDVIIKLGELSENISTLEIEPYSYKVLELNTNNLPSDLQIDIQVNGINLDSVVFHHSSLPNSWSLLTNGNWTASNLPTKGSSNESSALQNLIITEIYPSPQSGQSEWVEIFNSGDSAVNLEGLELCDQTACMELTGNLDPKGYLVITDPDISLNNGGDMIKLQIEDLLLNQFAYPQTNNGISQIHPWSADHYDTQIRATSIPTPGEVNRMSEAILVSIIKIAEAKQLEIGSEVTIQAIVTSSPGLFAVGEFYVQDDSAGIKIDLGPSINSEGIKLNRLLKVSGILKETSGEKKLYVTRQDALELQGEVRSVIAKTFSDQFSQMGSLVKVNGVVAKINSASIDLDVGESLVRVAKLSLAKLAEIAKGEKLEVSGILTQSGEILKLLPRFESDVVLVGDAVTSQVSISPIKTMSELNYQLPNLSPQSLPAVSKSNIPMWSLALGSLGMLLSSYLLVNRERYRLAN